MSRSSGPSSSAPTTIAGQQAWLPPSSHLSSKSSHHRDDTPARTNTPSLLLEDATMSESATVQYDGDNVEDEQRRQIVREWCRRTEAKIAGLLGGRNAVEEETGGNNGDQVDQLAADEPSIAEP